MGNKITKWLRDFIKQESGTLFFLALILGLMLAVKLRLGCANRGIEESSNEAPKRSIYAGMYETGGARSLRR